MAEEPVSFSDRSIIALLGAIDRELQKRRDRACCPLSLRERVRVRGNRRRVSLLIRFLLRLPLTPALSQWEREEEDARSQFSIQ
jgi:hypothetical protein